MLLRRPAQFGGGCHHVDEGGPDLLPFAGLQAAIRIDPELAILKARAPHAPAKLAKQVVSFVQAIRREELFKAPGVAETLDWASALVELDAVALDPGLVSDTLGALLKYQDDIQAIQGSRVKELLDQARAEVGR